MLQRDSIGMCLLFSGLFCCCAQEAKGKIFWRDLFLFCRILFFSFSKDPPVGRGWLRTRACVLTRDGTRSGDWSRGECAYRLDRLDREFRARLKSRLRVGGAMGGVSHEDYYPRLFDRSRRRRDDRFWAVGSLQSDQGKGRRTPLAGLHADDPNNSCRFRVDWPCAGLAAVARDFWRDRPWPQGAPVSGEPVDAFIRIRA